MPLGLTAIVSALYISDFPTTETSGTPASVAPILRGRPRNSPDSAGSNFLVLINLLISSIIAWPASTRLSKDLPLKTSLKSSSLVFEKTLRSDLRSSSLFSRREMLSGSAALSDSARNCAFRWAVSRAASFRSSSSASTFCLMRGSPVAIAFTSSGESTTSEISSMLVGILPGRRLWMARKEPDLFSRICHRFTSKEPTVT